MSRRGLIAAILAALVGVGLIVASVARADDAQAAECVTDDAQPPPIIVLLERIAVALERIADQMPKEGPPIYPIPQHWQQWQQWQTVTNWTISTNGLPFGVHYSSQTIDCGGAE